MADKVNLDDLIEKLGESQKHIDAVLGHARKMRDGGQDEAEAPESWGKHLTAADEAHGAALEMCGGNAGADEGGDEDGESEREAAYRRARDENPDHRRDFRPTAAGGPDNPAVDSLRGLALDRRTRRIVAREMRARATREVEAGAALEAILAPGMQVHRYRNHARE